MLKATNESGVWKPLSLAHMNLLHDSIFPLVNSETCLVYPCSLAHSGTYLKPAIEFDARLENVGLKFNIDLDFVRDNPTPSSAYLKENVIIEAIVYLLRPSIIIVRYHV